MRVRLTARVPPTRTQPTCIKQSGPELAIPTFQDEDTYFHVPLGNHCYAQQYLASAEFPGRRPGQVVCCMREIFHLANLLGKEGKNVCGRANTQTATPKTETMYLTPSGHLHRGAGVA